MRHRRRRTLKLDPRIDRSGVLERIMSKTIKTGETMAQKVPGQIVQLVQLALNQIMKEKYRLRIEVLKMRNLVTMKTFRSPARQLIRKTWK